MSFERAAEKISLDRWAGWGESERIYANVHACYRELSGQSSGPPDVQHMLGLMGARYFARRNAKSGSNAPGAASA